LTSALKSTNQLKFPAHWISLALFIITILTRLPFQSQYLYHWDSVNMAFGISNFDVLNGAPQFPGYIVYIALAQILNSFVNDHQTTMVIISIISSGLAVVAMFYLGRDMFNPATGLIAALFIMTSPLVWFYGEIALPHTMDLFCIILSAWMLYRIMEGDHRWSWLVLTAILLALVGGFRQQDLLFLGPLILFAIYRIGIVKFIAFGIVGFVVTVMWFVPLMQLSGGFQAYMDGSNRFTADFWNTTSLLRGAGITGLRRNLISKLIPYTLYAWGLAILPTLYWLPEIPKQWRAWLMSRKFWFLALWVTPTLAFYIIIHMGQQGLVFVFLPALMLISAEGLYRLFLPRPGVMRTATTTIAIAGAAIFIVGPTYPLGASGPKLLTYSTLRENDQLLANQIAAVRENFAPENTLLLASSWRHIQYYLPEYQLSRFSLGSTWEVEAGQVLAADFVGQPLTANQLGLEAGKDWQVVIINSELWDLSTTPLETIRLPNGFEMAYLPVKADQTFLINETSFGIKPESSS
jgi:4-amino-4-deoxy-L-arabinose transferase-like glycosyltransferase